MSAHTPGPWRVQVMANGEGLICVLPASNLAVADCCDMADARLIAAAPDMLDALKAALKIVDAYRKISGGDGDVTALTMRQTIAKATGSQAYE